MLPIVRYPADVLDSQAKRIIVFDEALHHLLDNMKVAMLGAKGIGLAAPQINEPFQICLISEDGSEEKIIELINPIITKKENQIPFTEGCLSIPNMFINTFRYSKISVDYQDRFGNTKTMDLEWMPAIIVQHEVDHLEGKTIASFLNSSQRRFLKRTTRK